MDGRAVPATVLAYDQETGFGLVQALARLELPALPLGQSKAARVGDQVVVAARAAASIRSRRVSPPSRNSPATGNTCSTKPSSPRPRIRFWGGTAMIGAGRRTARHRLAAGPAGARDRHARAAQHDRADRPLKADPRRPAHAWAAQPSAASMARPLRDRDRRQSGGRARRDRRAIATGQPANRRYRARGGGRSRSAISPAFSAGSGRWAMPGSRCR